MPSIHGFTQDTARMLNQPLIELASYYDRLDAAELHAVVRDLDAALERAARVRAYVDTRLTFGQDHARAVKASNALANKVRKLLGYTYPSEVTF